jgi:hypothetical protein
MGGKIFPQSIDLQQDQARILFEYYQKMAENIVAEEERLEREIDKLRVEKHGYDARLASFWQRLILLFTFKLKGIRKEADDLDARMNELRRQHDGIFRGYKVSKLGVVYVPVADRIKYEDKSFMVDYSGSIGEKEITLKISRQNDLLVEKIHELEELTRTAPLVETSDDTEELDVDHYSTSMQKVSQHDYFGGMERTLRTISYCMDDLDVTSVALPLVTSDSNYISFLDAHATDALPAGATVFEVFNASRHQDDIAKFHALTKLKDSLSTKTAKFEDVLKELMMTMATSVQAISALKVASTEKLVIDSNKVLYKILKSPYNHYSPVLEASEIERIRLESFNYSDAVQDYMPFMLREGSKVRYNLVTEEWIAEDGSTTVFPFGVHQIHEEIVAPIVQSLMAETRLERIKIYNHIKDQKISYLNKWHQDTEDFYGRNRAESADLINLMRATLRDYIAAYNTLASLQSTEDTMEHSDGSLDATVVATTDNSAEVFAAYELQSKEFQSVQTEFETYMERLKEDIDHRAEGFEHIDYYDGLLRDSLPHEAAVAASEVHDIDARRRPLILVNPLFAKTSELPPEPGTESVLDEHMMIHLPGLARNALKDLHSSGSVDPPRLPGQAR